jgi:hypothetical protein
MGAVSITISKDLLLELLSEKAIINSCVCTSGLPPGCVFKGAGTNKDNDLIICFEGPNLPFCQWGGKPEHFTPVYEQIAGEIAGASPSRRAGK